MYTEISKALKGLAKELHYANHHLAPLARSQDGSIRRSSNGSIVAIINKLEIPVVALSQLNRQLERRDDKRPRISDLRESGSLEQDADIVAFIHREEVFKKKEERINYEGKAELIIAKQRNGPTDSIPLAFLKAHSRFENLALEDHF